MFTQYVNKTNLRTHDMHIDVFELRNRAVHENDRTE